MLNASSPDTISFIDFGDANVIASSKFGAIIETHSLLAYALANGLPGEGLLGVTDPSGHSS